jgi:hypothetical protein
MKLVRRPTSAASWPRARSGSEPAGRDDNFGSGLWLAPRRELAIALEQERHDAADLAGRNRGAGLAAIRVDGTWQRINDPLDPPFRAVNGDHRDSVRIAAAENGLPFGKLIICETSRYRAVFEGPSYVTR